MKIGLSIHNCPYIGKLTFIVSCFYNNPYVELTLIK
jgi:hypothetical protein